MLPKHLDEKVARLHLDALGVRLTQLSDESGGLHRRARRGPLQARPLPLLGAAAGAERRGRTSQRGRAAQVARRRRPRAGRRGAQAGRARIAWADTQMPVLAQIRGRFERERPLAGVRVAACLHVTAETANLVRTLIAGGAEVGLCAANPLSTQDDVVAALVARRWRAVHARRGESAEEYAAHVDALVGARPAGHDRRRRRPGRADPRDRPRAAPRRCWGAPRRRPRASCGCAAWRPRRAGLPGARGQRVAHRAGLQRPLRHGPVDGGRHPAGHEPAAGGAHRGGAWDTAGRAGVSRCARGVRALR